MREQQGRGEGKAADTSVDLSCGPQAPAGRAGEWITTNPGKGGLVYVHIGFDHGVGHPLLLLDDAKTPHGQKVKKFNGLGHAPSNIPVSLF